MPDAISTPGMRAIGIAKVWTGKSPGRKKGAKKKKASGRKNGRRKKR